MPSGDSSLSGSGPLPGGQRGESCPVPAGKADLFCLIGGFSKGEFRSDAERAGEAISIFNHPLTAWTVASKVIFNYENVLGL
jgi:rRNA pseudouridine-1189 N-methylase Emg1 (Nep1/Mra1 family)